MSPLVLITFGRNVTDLHNPNSNKGYGHYKKFSWDSDDILISYGSPTEGFDMIEFFTDANCKHQSGVPNLVGSYNDQDCFHPGFYRPDQIGSVETLGQCFGWDG